MQELLTSEFSRGFRSSKWLESCAARQLLCMSFKKKSKAEQTEITSFLENQLLSARTVGADKHQQC